MHSKLDFIEKELLPKSIEINNLTKRMLGK